MKNLSINKTLVFGFLMILASNSMADVALTADGKVPGTPFKYLQDQIDTIELTPGPQGIQGLKGDKGDTGAQGPQGLQGLTGAAGTNGLDGTQGPQGLPGTNGTNGTNGADGAPGTNGIDGAPGLPGTDGADGADGFNGAAGADGAQGPAGISCWDLNGNSVNDANEDVNSDGSFNALDCAGNLDLSSILQRLTYLENRLQNSDFDNDGYTPAAGDCNDSDFAISPNAVEIDGDSIDNNCDGIVDGIVDTPTDIDQDGDGFTVDTGDCNDLNAEIYPGQYDSSAIDPNALLTWSWEGTSGVSDGVDNDCDGVIDQAPSTTADYDGDGLTDADEVNVYKTNPTNTDTDNDNLSDFDEIMVYNTDPNWRDTDGATGTCLDGPWDEDYLNDGEEVLIYGTDPLLCDTDGDGLTDGAEIQGYEGNYTDPLNPDGDGDGLTDGEEILIYGTWWNVVDSDCDGVSDGIEVNVDGTDPLDGPCGPYSGSP